MSVISVVFSQYLAVDTSAIMALLDPQEQYHAQAVDFFSKAQSEGAVWHALNVTTHELYTRVRYNHRNLQLALSRYDYLRAAPFRPLQFDASDENEARSLIAKHHDQVLSYHDALCAAVMFREGIYKIFSFDRDFWVFGFEIYPGQT
jgi:predicted nucleic acid-binding protein